MAVTVDVMYMLGVVPSSLILEGFVQLLQLFTGNYDYAEHPSRGVQLLRCQVAL